MKLKRGSLLFTAVLAAIAVFVLSLKVGAFELFGLKKDNKFSYIIGNFTKQMELFRQAELKNGAYVYERGNLKVIFTVNPRYQQMMEDAFKEYRVKYGAFVAIDPKTGKVLCAVSSIPYPDMTMKNTFLTASTFKIVTAAAALENGISPTQKFLTGGKGDSCFPGVWFSSPYKVYRDMVSAFANSANPYFGIVGRILGQKKLLSYAKRFGYNRKDLGFPWGTIDKPVDEYDLAAMAAGLGDTRSSPMHQALIAATIVNNGVMMKPTLVSKIFYNGKLVYSFKPHVLRRVIRLSTAEEIRKLMLLTVKSGTASSRRMFRLLKRFPYVQMGGKTGTLTEYSFPSGRVEWFVGFGKFEDKNIAVSSLAVNGAKFWITGYEISALFFYKLAKHNLLAKR